MTRQDNAVPSPAVHLAEYWSQYKRECILELLLKMASKIGRSLQEEITGLTAEV